MTFKVARPNRDNDIQIELSIPGAHNVLNATAAIAIASHLGVSDDAIIQGLRDFQGVGRRFQIFGDVTLGGKNITLVDDYAHHPVELDALYKCLPISKICLCARYIQREKNQFQVLTVKRSAKPCVCGVKAIRFMCRTWTN